MGQMTWLCLLEYNTYDKNTKYGCKAVWEEIKKEAKTFSTKKGGEGFFQKKKEERRLFPTKKEGRRLFMQIFPKPGMGSVPGKF